MNYFYKNGFRKLESVSLDFDGLAASEWFGFYLRLEFRLKISITFIYFEIIIIVEMLNIRCYEIISRIHRIVLKKVCSLYFLQLCYQQPVVLKCNYISVKNQLIFLIINY